MKISKAKMEILIATQGITYTQLAERSGVSRQNISTIKNRGTCIPRTAAKLAAGLGVNVEELIEQEDSKE